MAISTPDAPVRAAVAAGIAIAQGLARVAVIGKQQFNGSGGTGGTFNSYNFTGSTIPPTFINNTQSWGEVVKTPVGLLTISHSTQDEFYNGELPGTEYIVTNGELNPDNDFKYPTTLEIYYDPTLYLSNITPLENFLNLNTIPAPGEIYLWFDTGSILQPGAGIVFKFKKFSNGVILLKYNVGS